MPNAANHFYLITFNHPQIVTTAEFVRQSRVPSTESVFFLGCFENRVTLYSQQIRALNLVDAIIAEKLVRPKGKVAIVGGGIGGITAASAFAKLAPETTNIDLFEARDDILDYQRGSSRYLHPHNYDWPAASAAQPDAGLPILNWQAGEAKTIAGWLRQQFNDICVKHRNINVRKNMRVTKILPYDGFQVRLFTNDQATSDNYDVIILCIGFGLEAFLREGDTPSYWSPIPLDAPVLVPGQAPNTIFVSGNGDGGLVDFMFAAFDGLSHKEICDLIVGQEFGAALQEIQRIEDDAWLPGADVDLYDPPVSNYCETTSSS